VTKDEKKSNTRPMYWRVLHLKHVYPSSWQRAAFFEGSLALAAILVLADLASAWLLLVLPLSVAVIVKAHDVLVGWLGTTKPHAAVPEAVTEDEAEDTAVEPLAETAPTQQPEPAPDPEPEPNVRVVPQSKPRAARARPGAAAARAQVSAATGVRQRRTEPRPKKAESSS
jgi:hypothetical protein